MILEQGLNVKVLLLPDGEDPDSFSKKTTTDDLILFIEENTQDFIKFKASLLQKEAKNDPVKKGELIRSIIESIAKIPNNIQQEIYIKEVAGIMDISEKVLFRELALVQKGIKRRLEKEIQRKKQAESLKPVKKNKETKPTLTKREILEREIIKLLLLYANREIEINDIEIKEIPDDNSEPIVEKIIRKSIVAEEIYKQLQEDELEFSHPVFNRIYKKIIGIGLERKPVEITNLIPNLDDEEAKLISDILMEEEKYSLANWEGRRIEVTPKDGNLGWHVIDVLFNLRRLLIQELIEKQKEKLKDIDEEKRIEIFNEIKDYLILFRLISTQLYRFA
jgi:DNA primase